MLQNKVTSLEDTVSRLENQLDDLEQYERSDTIIINGPALPREQNHENSTDLVANAIIVNLHISINHADINVAHRLGYKSQNKERPVIVKLLNRSKNGFGETFAVALDISTAFDRVWHKALISKLPSLQVLLMTVPAIN